MKKIFLTGILLLNVLFVFACPVCERNQPKVLKGITHGAGPESQWDYVIELTTAAIVLVTLFFSVEWLVRAGVKYMNV